MDLTGEAESEPQKIGTPAADLLAGMDAALATVAALFERQRTGRGHRIDVSLVESMTRLMTPRLVSYLGSGELPRRSGARDSVLAIYQAFETADAPITLGDRQRRDLATVLRRRRRAGHGRGPALRVQCPAARRRARSWSPGSRRSSAPAGGTTGSLCSPSTASRPARSARLDEVAADPGLRERGLFYRMARDGRRARCRRSIPASTSTARANAPRRPPPALGEHTADVLRSVLGKSDDDIARLRAAGIV